MTIKRFPDRCYAVVIGSRRGPCAHDKPTAIQRYKHSGLIASAKTDKPRLKFMDALRLQNAWDTERLNVTSFLLDRAVGSIFYIRTARNIGYFHMFASGLPRGYLR